MPAAIPLGREFLARLTTEQVALRWILGLATALSLWIGGVDWLGAAQYPDARALRIESVPFEERAHPEAKGAQVWIRWLRLENRLPAPEDVISIEGPWDFDRPEHRAVLEDGTNRAALELCGRSLSFSVLKHPWSGALRLYADGELVMTVPLYAETPEFETIVLPPRESNLSAILIALLCVSGLALLIRPWKGERRLPLWLALIVGYPHLMVSLYAPVGTTNDTIGYPGAFESMLQGRPHYFPPGYGALTELMSALPGHTGLYLVALQHLFVVLCVVLLYRCFKGFAGPAWSFAGAFLGGIAYPTVMGAQTVMSDTLTFCLLTCSGAMILNSKRVSSIWQAVVLGLLIGWAALVRVIPAAVLVPLATLARWPSRDRAWRFLAVALLIGLGLPLVAIANNGLRSGQWQLSTGVGKHLYNHFVFEQKLLDPEGDTTKRLLEHMGEEDPRNLPHWDLAPFIVGAASEEQWQYDRVYLDVALEAALTTGVLEHLLFTTKLSWSNLVEDSYDSISSDAWPGQPEQFAHGGLAGNETYAQELRARLRSWNSWSWPVLCYLALLSLLGLCFVRREARLAWLAWIWIALSYMFASSAVEYHLPRYHVGVSPIIGALAVCTFGILLQRLSARVATDRPPRASITRPSPD